MDDGGRAFPSVSEIQFGDMDTAGHSGMSLRDYFAGQALVGYLSEGTLTIAPQLATWCYANADALIAERGDG